MIQIQFLDKSIPDALIPAFSLQPERVLFFYEEGKTERREMYNIRNAIQRRMPGTEVDFIGIDTTRLTEIRSQVKETLLQYDPKDVLVDISGGEEYMTASGLLLCYEHGYTATYINPASGSICNAVEENEICPAVKLGIEDYLTAMGLKRRINHRAEPKPPEFERFTRQAEVLFDNLDRWQLLYQFLSRYCSAPDCIGFDLGDEVHYRRAGQDDSDPSDVTAILDSFVENGFLRRISDTSYHFNDSEKEYLTTFGIWLELYVYIKAQDLFDEVYCGFMIDWDDADRHDTTDNEIDVLAMKDSAPIFISCKMRKPMPSDIYEVAFLAKRFGGDPARALLATTYDVSRERDLKMGIYQRFRKMNVGYITVDDFRKKDAMTVFRQAFTWAE